MIDATRKTYFSPDDDCQKALLDLVSSATKKIRLADFSFNLDPLVELLLEKQSQGVDISLVLDKSQSAGSTEKPEVLKLKTSGVPMVIGTSDKHKIMHLKIVIVDDAWVGSGSYNFTTVAEQENNVFEVESSPDRAAVFTQAWQRVHDFIQANEAQTV